METMMMRIETGTGMVIEVEGNHVTASFPGMRRDDADGNAVEPRWSQDAKQYDHPPFEQWCTERADGLVSRCALVDGDMPLVFIFDERPPFTVPGEADPRGDCFGWVMNLDTPEYSEWGYAPYPERGEDWDAMTARHEAGLAAFMAATGITVDEDAVYRGPGIEPIGPGSD